MRLKEPKLSEEEIEANIIALIKSDKLPTDNRNIMRSYIHLSKDKENAFAFLEKKKFWASLEEWEKENIFRAIDGEPLLEALVKEPKRKKPASNRIVIIV